MVSELRKVCSVLIILSFFLIGCQQTEKIVNVESVDIVCVDKEEEEDISLDGKYTDYIWWSDILLNSSQQNEIYEGSNKEIIIAVIDTVFDLSYTDKKMLWINSGEISGDGIDNDNNGYIDDYYGCKIGTSDSINVQKKTHGTFILNLLAGNNGTDYVGLLNGFNVKIMLVEVLSGVEETCSIEELVEAIKYAENMGAKICNMSLSTYIDSAVLRKTLFDSEMLFVVPAGNEGKEVNEEYSVYPAYYDFDNIISVAAITPNRTIWTMSNYSETSIDVAAPGCEVISIFEDGKMYSRSGTSYAVPFVTALVSILETQTDIEMSASELKEIIKDNVIKTDELKSCVDSEGYICYGFIKDYFKEKVNEE